MTAWVILIAACALIVHQIWRDRRTFPAFEALEESHLRRKSFANWTADSFFRYGVTGLIGLFLLDAAEAFWRLPEDLGRDVAQLGDALNLSGNWLGIAGWGLTLFLVIGLVAGAVAGFSMKADAIPKEGVGALLARNWREARWTALLSVNAGLVEEIFFRAMLFIALYQVSGSVLVALAGATVLFAVAHSYQGIAGVLSSGLIGAIFMVIYAATGALWLVIALHALLDLRGLVLLPWSLGWLSSDKEIPS